MSDQTKKSQPLIQLQQIQATLRQQLQLAYVKINSQIERIMGPDLKQCIDKAINDQTKINQCYEKLENRVKPVLEKLKQRTIQSNANLTSCMESKKNAKECAKIGVQKIQEFVNETLNDLKLYLSEPTDKQVGQKVGGVSTSVMKTIEAGQELQKDSVVLKDISDQAQVHKEEHYKNAQAEIKQNLKKGHINLTNQLQLVYEGMLKNCIKQSQDQPHKIHKCWDEFQVKMKPVFETLGQKTKQSGESLKKCFESRRNAKECIRESIDFGQKALNDASNAIKSYLH